MAATYPSFDPDTAGQGRKGDLRQQVLEQVYEPGSVQKVVTMAALADAGLVNACHQAHGARWAADRRTRPCTTTSTTAR